jgi:hypothetical protein
MTGDIKEVPELQGRTGSRPRHDKGALPMTDIAPGRDEPVPVAVALLDRHWPATPPLADIAGASTSASVVAALESDPRYVMGRLQQALTVLLAVDLPPMDAQTALLSQALIDAIAWRRHDGRPCRDCGVSLCESCNADGDQADRYHALARALGAVGDPLPPAGGPV